MKHLMIEKQKKHLNWFSIKLGDKKKDCKCNKGEKREKKSDRKSLEIEFISKICEYWFLNIFVFV